MSGARKLCSTNKEALRWCKTRRAKLMFKDCADTGRVECFLYLGKKLMRAETLIKVVNKWIKHFNKEGD